jgi:hypothetical protein
MVRDVFSAVFEAACLGAAFIGFAMVLIAFS